MGQFSVTAFIGVTLDSAAGPVSILSKRRMLGVQPAVFTGENSDMALFRFTGRVLPPSTQVTMKDLPSVYWEDAALGLKMDATISIIDSAVEVVCDSTLDNFSEVYMRAFDMTRAAIDSFAFVHGLGLSVLLEKVILPSGIEQNIRVEEPELAALVTAFDLRPENKETRFEAMSRIVLSDPSIFLALNDLIVSISLSPRAGQLRKSY